MIENRSRVPPIKFQTRPPSGWRPYRPEGCRFQRCGTVPSRVTVYRNRSREPRTGSVVGFVRRTGDEILGQISARDDVASTDDGRTGWRDAGFKEPGHDLDVIFRVGCTSWLIGWLRCHI